ncbi:hypothetical protein INR49_016636 [Caranx melampygus]|nr:hypothetical protein INR49_016636 [Caranx melampygus]
MDGEVKAKRLASEKAQAAARAEADAQYEVQSEVSRILSAERAVAQESLQQAIIRERIATEDERLRAQIFKITETMKKFGECRLHGRVVLMRFYGSEQPAQLMVLEGEILIER